MNTQTIHNYGDGTWGNYTYTFGYDDMNRLTNASSSAGQYSAAYTYDNDGHMTTKNFAGVNNSFNRETTNHRIANILENGVSKAVSYDSRGNLTSDALSGWTTYEFNRSNLPLYMNSGNKSYRFGYNEKGERIAKDFEDDTTETKEKYLLDYLGRTFVVYNNNRNMEGIINGSGLIGSISVTDSSANYFYFLKDHLGNIRTTVDANGAVTTARDFGPYGETLREYSAEETVDRYQYTEKERDKESRDTYFGARSLSGYFPFWKSVDPLAEKYPGVSPYTYVLGNPMNLIDPKGTEVDWTKDDLFNWLADGNDGFPVKKTNQNNGSTNNNNKDYYNRTNDGNVTLKQFINRFSGMTYKQIVKGKSKFLWIEYPNDISDRRFRFMIDPLTNQEIDMIHFFVVGNLGHFMGIGNEVQQAFRFSGSAFWPQDIHSNILGVQFFERYGKAIESNPTKIINYLNEFFNDKSRLQIREYPDSINPF